MDAERLSLPARLARALATTQGERLAAALLLACFAALAGHGLVRDAVTVDEFAHLPDGLYILRTGDLSLFPLNPPLVKVVSALPLLALRAELDTTPQIRHHGWYPWVYGTDFMARNRERYRLLFAWGRLPVLLLGLLLGVVIWRWARALYGPHGGLLALLLYAFCPAFIAHAHLATIDVGHALLLVLALAAADRLLRRPSLGNGVLCGLALGLAQLAKHTAVLLYPVLLLLVVVALARRGAPDRRRLAAAFGLALLLSLVVLDAGYLFAEVGHRAGDYRFSSHRLAGLFAALPPGLPVPLPADWLVGFDALQAINEVGEYPTYLLGEVRYGRQPAYFPLTLLLKTPLPLLAAWLLAPFARGGDRRREQVVWLPALALLAAFSLLSQVHYGIRYVLPVVALGIVYAGRLAPHLAQQSRRVRLAAALVLALYPCSAVLATPDSIDYFNLFAAGRGDAFLLDSNLDWGQGLERLADWMQAAGVERVGLAYFGHADPALYGIAWELPRPGGPLPEWTAVSANFLHGLGYATYLDGRIVPVPPDAFTWLADSPERRYLGGGLFLVHTGAR